MLSSGPGGEPGVPTRPRCGRLQVPLPCSALGSTTRAGSERAGGRDALLQGVL